MSESTETKKKVVPYQPRELDSKKVRIAEFKPKNLLSNQVYSYAETKKSFGSFANTDVGIEKEISDSRFKLHPESKRLLGVEQEEQGIYEDLVQSQVQERLAQLKEQAYQDGFQQGLIDGKTEAESKHQEEMSPVFQSFNQALLNLDKIKDDLYLANEKVLLQVMYSMGKEILLRDLQADVHYVKRLSSLLIERLGIKDFVKIKVSKEDFARIDELKDFLKTQYPDIKNIQIEASTEIELGGCKVETDLIKVNATVESQLKSIEEALQGHA